MSSSGSSLTSRFIEWMARHSKPLLRKLGDYDEIHAALSESNARYLNADILARVLRCSRDEAEKELFRAVDKGLLEPRYIFESPEVPISIVIDKEHIGQTIVLSEAGIGGEHAEKEVELSGLFTREIYVATR